MQAYRQITKINKITHVSMPYGPHKITKVRQVAIPGELLRAIGLGPGANVHFRLSDSDPHVIEIVPSDIIASRYQTGADADALERLSQPSTPDDLLPNDRKGCSP
jgi:bifunctional DNA-binding transcriptional regulator/antitoxin component of YhaV-PrlF toxin-antitoxin module